MQTQEIYVNGEKKTIITKLPEEYKEENQTLPLEDTLDLRNIQVKIKELTELNHE